MREALVGSASNSTSSSSLALYERMLSFEPVSVDEVQEVLKALLANGNGNGEATFKPTKDLVREFLSREGVVQQK